MQRFFRPSHPFHLLLYLEWILLGIAAITVFSHVLPPPPAPHRSLPSQAFAAPFYLGAILSMISLGLMGFKLPTGSKLTQGLYTILGLGLSWLAVLWGGHGQNVFPPLLLIVVIRACLMFPWSGRLLVAALAYISFLLMLLMSLLGIRPLGVPLDRPLPRAVRRLSAEALQSLLVSLTLNSVLLFGLVLGFVLLLVGTVLAEYQSRQQLTEANHRLRQYSLLIENQATLQERNRIAREIHDSVGHSLVAQSIQLENVAMLLPQDATKLADHLQKARQLGREALQHVRQSVATLRTDPLRGRSLPEALSTLIQEFQRDRIVQIESEFNITSPVSTEMATALYRITQEALTNILKHSRADRVWLKLIENSTQISLLIKDNGQGFEPTQNTTGFGLQSMRERTKALAGSFYLNSQSGKGCSIQVVIPR